MVGRADGGRGMLTREDRIAATDALVTADIGLVLTTLHADCTPVYLVDLDRRTIALAHCGWRSTIGGLAGKTLSLLKTEFGCDPRRVRVAFGPAISAAVYEVGGEVAAQFASRFGAVTVAHRSSRAYLDIAAALTIDLLENGLPSDAIPERPPCTYADRRFASFRREGAPTRSMLAWLVREA